MKRFSIGLVAILMAIGFAAFTTPKKVANKNALNNFYRYTLNTNTGMKNPLNYEWVSTPVGQCDDGDQVVCIISSPGSSGTGVHPSFPNNTDPYSNSEGVSVEYQKPLQ